MRYFLGLIFSIASCSFLAAEVSFRCKPDTAQYKGSDYANVVDVARNISLEQAFEIAKSLPEADYFVYTKGWQMVLEIPKEISFDPTNDPFELVSCTRFSYDSGQHGEGYCRIFRKGDAVFFKKEGLWLGSAPCLADTYFKEIN